MQEKVMNLPQFNTKYYIAKMLECVKFKENRKSSKCWPFLGEGVKRSGSIYVWSFDQSGYLIRIKLIKCVLSYKISQIYENH